MSPKLTLYGTKLSAPVRTVLLTLKALKLEFEFQELNPFNKDQLQADFIKKNPQQTVPALEDDDQMIVDSHAIAAYLVSKYHKSYDDEKLYPKDFHARAIVDQRLYYEAATLFATCLKQITGAYGVLEQFLAHSLYMADEHLTIADFSIVSTVSTFDAALEPIDASKWPKLAVWLKRMEALPYYADANGIGMKSYATLIHSKLPKQYEKLWKKALVDIKSGRQ
ncbi:glutathione S-transferase 1-like [Eurosta solidaginis]|uniref:glutathione S-transferase 1-like n=1 Tax=Eurosta solidaginis TaxID=178769 RepID=UPI003530D07A